MGFFYSGNIFTCLTDIFLKLSVHSNTAVMLGNILAVFTEQNLLSVRGVLTRQPLKLESIVDFLQLRKILVFGRRKLCNIIVPS